MTVSAFARLAAHPSPEARRQPCLKPNRADRWCWRSSGVWCCSRSLPQALYTSCGESSPRPHSRPYRRATRRKTAGLALIDAINPARRSGEIRGSAISAGSARLIWQSPRAPGTAPNGGYSAFDVTVSDDTQCPVSDYDVREAAPAGLTRAEAQLLSRCPLW